MQSSLRVSGRRSASSLCQCARSRPSIKAQAAQFSTSLRNTAKNPKPKAKLQSPKPKPIEYSPSVRQSQLKKPDPIPEPKSNPNPLKFRTVPLVFLSLTAFAISGYVGYAYVSYKRTVAEGLASDVPADTSERYDLIADKFDMEVDNMEKLMGLPNLRKKLCQEAYGDVLEVSIGTGRNLEFYDWNFSGHNGVGRVQRDHTIKVGKVKSFTAVDKSAEMLEVAHQKFSERYPGILGIRWIVQDAAEPIPNPPLSANERSGSKPDKKYDTIVQTMGLCSTGDPVGLLKNLGKSLEKDGRILLLEHGKGTWGWVNDILDGLAPRHAREFGCWWNRDIGEIVRESGLEVVEVRRKHFGTTWWVELRLPKEAKNGREGEKKVAA